MTDKKLFSVNNDTLLKRKETHDATGNVILTVRSTTYSV